MNAESVVRAAFWMLLAGVLVMRVYFALKVRRSGERVMPDHEAVEREGRGMFAIRFVLFLILIGWLILYAINPIWMKALSIDFPNWLRWIGFAWVSPVLDCGHGLRLRLEKSGHLNSNCEKNTIW